MMVMDAERLAGLSPSFFSVSGRAKKEATDPPRLLVRCGTGGCPVLSAGRECVATDGAQGGPRSYEDARNCGLGQGQGSKRREVSARFGEGMGPGRVGGVVG
jgi:hypothetical protein